MMSTRERDRHRRATPRRGVVIAATSAVLLAAIAIDAVTKAIAVRELADGRTIGLVPTISLHLVFNPGVAFGAGASAGPPLRGLLLALLAALLGWVVRRVVVGAPLIGTLALAVAAGGGAGNVLDRIGTGAGFLSDPVTDFIAVDWFAVFNIADVFTTCGIALWVVTDIFQASHTHTKQREPRLDDRAADD